MSVRPFQNHLPHIAPDCYIDETAVVIGRVKLAGQVNIWPCAVIRGDVNRIRIGRRSNIQDLSMLHVSQPSTGKPDGSPLIIGEEVTVGHHCTLHGCIIGNRVLIGMGSTVLDDAVIEDNVILSAGSLVPPRKRLESGFLYMGTPAQAVRPLTDGERAFLTQSADNYVRLAETYRNNGQP